jgi:hypothetical protein
MAIVYLALWDRWAKDKFVYLQIYPDAKRIMYIVQCA